MKDPNGMKIKSYFAKSVDEAIARARVELGSEALLLNTRKMPDTGSGVAYEVVMGVAGAAAAPEAGREPAAAARTAVRTPWHAKANPARATETPARATEAVARATPAVFRETALPARPIAAVRETALPTARETALPKTESAPRTEVVSEMEKLRAQMDELQSLLVRSAKNAWVAQRSVPEVAELYDRLVAAEVDPALSKDIADRLEAAMATDAFFLYTGPDAEGAQNRWKTLKSDSARVDNFLRTELESRVGLRPRLGVNGTQGAVAAVVGAAGSGKTTSLAKLAMAACAQRPVRLVSLDPSRTAQQLLGSLATPAITFTTVDSIENLPKLVSEARQKECVLIDTPGNNTQEGLAAALAACGDVDVHLVAPGYMKARDLRNSIERYGVFQPSKLLLTRMDETSTLGSVFSEAAQSGLALSFLSHGARIPEDIRAATVEDLLGMVRELPRARAASHQAA